MDFVGRQWRLSRSADAIVLVRRGIRPNERNRALAPQHASHLAGSWFSAGDSDPFTRHQLLSIVHEISNVPLLNASRVSTRDLVREVERALADGRLIALRQAHRTRLGTSARPSQSPAGAAPVDQTERVTFVVKTQALDEKLDGLRVEVELATGRKVLTTNAGGEVTIERQPGQSIRVVSIDRKEGEKKR